MKMIKLLLPLLLLAGCNAWNAEQKQWDSQGNLISQTRYGQCNVLYWFGVRSGEVYSEPGKVFWVTASGLETKPDPNSIKAVGAAVGSAAGQIFKH